MESLPSQGSMSIENFESAFNIVIANVNNYNLRRFFAVSHKSNVNNAQEHYNLVFNPALFDTMAGNRHVFYNYIGYWEVMKQYRELIKTGVTNNELFQKQLQEKILNNFRQCWGERIQNSGQTTHHQ